MRPIGELRVFEVPQPDEVGQGPRDPLPDRRSDIRSGPEPCREELPVAAERPEELPEGPSPSGTVRLLRLLLLGGGGDGGGGDGEGEAARGRHGEEV